MLRGELVLALFLTLLGITLQSPYSQFPSLYSPSNQQYSPFIRQLYSSNRRQDEEHDLDKLASHHLSVHRGSPDYHQDQRSQPLSHPKPELFNFDPELKNEPQRIRRQAFLPYFPYQLPFLPPFYQVHNIYLTPPGHTCYPSTPVTDRPSKRPNDTLGPDDDLGTRFGVGDSKNETGDASKKPPSKCVWSIVACCSPGSRDIRYACFELLGCPGAFWDVNPCDERVVAAAANAALRYYMNNQSPTPEPSFQNL